MYLTEELRERSFNRDKIPELAHPLFTDAEYRVAEEWRQVYLRYMRSISSNEMSDAECEAAKSDYMRGVEILEAQDLSKKYKTPDGRWRDDYKKRKRVLHAVNALCVYGEPDELGNQEFTMKAAKVGLADLVENNFRSSPAGGNG